VKYIIEAKSLVLKVTMFPSSFRMIGYAPQITNDEKENIKKDGIKVFRCDDCLIDYLEWKKRHPFRRRKSYRDVDCRKGKTFSNRYYKKGRK
jgi:hypothetical protein